MEVNSGSHSLRARVCERERGSKWNKNPVFVLFTSSLLELYSTKWTTESLLSRKIHLRFKKKKKTSYLFVLPSSSSSPLSLQPSSVLWDTQGYYFRGVENHGCRQIRAEKTTFWSSDPGNKWESCLLSVRSSLCSADVWFHFHSTLTFPDLSSQMRREELSYYSERSTYIYTVTTRRGFTNTSTLYLIDYSKCCCMTVCL